MLQAGCLFLLISKDWINECGDFYSSNFVVVMF